MSIRRISWVVIVASALGTSAGAQATPFLFTVMPTTGSPGRSTGFGYYELGYGERTFEPVAGDRMEHAVGVRASFGQWDPEEKDGGARLMVGPSLSIAPPTARWQLTVGGGPIVRATRSAFSSGADRPLPTRNGYVIPSAVGFSW